MEYEVKSGAWITSTIVMPHDLVSKILFSSLNFEGRVTDLQLRRTPNVGLTSESLDKLRIQFILI